MKARSFSNVGKVSPILQKPVNSVFETSDYDLFQLSKFNRNVLLRKEMLEQAKEGFIAPIVVNENFVVIDGQHRLEASKKIGVPVTYIVMPGLDENDIVRMNTVQKPWSLQNYIEAFANQGLEEYVKLVDLIKAGHANVTVTTYVAMNNLGDRRVRNLITDGKFKFHNYEKAVEFLHYYTRFREETKTKKRTTVATALYELFRLKNFDRNRMILKTISTNLNEDINVKTFIHTDILKSLIDAYNNMLQRGSDKLINYYISSSGNLVIDGERQGWAVKKNKKESGENV